MRKRRIIKRKNAGPDHDVVQVRGETSYRKTPCAECPWRLDSKIGAFPAEAYLISANTAFDMSLQQFACHMAGTSKPQTCAGFLLQNSANNLSMRIALSQGKIDLSQISAGGLELYASYRQMAVANGVSPSHPILQKCRADFE